MNIFRKIFGGQIDNKKDVKSASQQESDHSQKEKYNVYETIKIGKQEWMTENLNVSCFRNGDQISEVKSESDWYAAGNAGKPVWCYYDNDQSHGKTYGKLYNWHAVNDPRGLAPEDFHIPNNEEWTILKNYLGGEDFAGGQLKSKDGWNNPNKGATNKSGFKALAGGCRQKTGAFNAIGRNAGFWSKTSKDKDAAYSFSLSCALEGFYNEYFACGIGCSVRCVKD